MQVGDWVMVSSGGPCGRDGVIIADGFPKYGEYVLVRFPGWTDGHGGNTVNGHNYNSREYLWIRLKHLKLAKIERLKKLLQS